MATTAQRRQHKAAVAAYETDTARTRLAAILTGFAAEATDIFLGTKDPSLAKNVGRAGCRTLAALSICTFLKPDLLLDDPPEPPV